MKRMHIHVGVDNLEQGIRFYSALFGTDPIKTKPDYAKWMPNDVKVNFAISTGSRTKGIDHLGLQVDEDHELAELRQRLQAADLSTYDEGETVCCYARSEKTWVTDPSGIAWEAYRTMDDAEVYASLPETGDTACCTPETRGKAGCCAPQSDTAACCA